MEKVMERLDGAFAFLVPLCYMAGLIGGTAYYFTDGQASVFGGVLVVGICLAMASEMNSFLVQRRFRIAWHKLSKADNPADEEDARRDLKVYGGLLAGLLAFQCFTGIMYRLETFHPAGPPWWQLVQIIISGTVIPLAFFTLGFIVQVVVDAADVQAKLKSETAIMTAKAGATITKRAINATIATWKHRIRAAERAHADMGALAVGLARRFGDDESAMTLGTIDKHLREIEGLDARTLPGKFVCEDGDNVSQEDKPKTNPVSIDEVPPEMINRAEMLLRNQPHIKIKDFQRALGIKSYDTAWNLFYRMQEMMGDRVTRVPPKKPRTRKREGIAA